MPTAESERAGRRALELAGALEPDESLLVLLSGGASALMAVPADRTDARRQAGDDAPPAAGWRRHPRAQHRPQAPVRDQGRVARRRAPRRVPHVRDLGRRRRRSQRHRVGADGAGRQHVPRRARRPASALQAGRPPLSAGGRRTHRRRRAGGEVPETPKPDDARLSRASHVGHRWPAPCDGRRGRRRPHRAATTSSRIDDAVVGDARSSAVSHLRAALARAADVARPACIVSSGETTVRVTGRRHRAGATRSSPSRAADAAGRARRARRRSPASAPTGSTARPTPPARSSIRRRSIARAPPASTRAAFLDRQRRLHFFDALGDLIHTGPTGTNVGDLQVFLLA